MPVYEYRCPACGPFDVRRGFEQAVQPAPCPTCSSPARRVYTAPATRSRSGPFAGASAADRALLDRARSGEPTLTTARSGPRLPSRPHRH